jgi:altronate dehydratase large subunit
MTIKKGLLKNTGSYRCFFVKEIIKYRYVDNFCKRVYPRPAPALVGDDQGACAFVLGLQVNFFRASSVSFTYYLYYSIKKKGEFRLKYSFEGYLRKDGTAGIRNHVGIVCSVVCSSVVAKEISEKVPGTVPVVHGNGCAQLGDDFKVTKNMVAGTSMNPNFYAALLVGLGCESNQISGLLDEIPETKSVKGIGIQQLAGGGNTVIKGADIASQWAKEAASEPRQPLPLSSLSVGILTVDINEETMDVMAPVIGEVVDVLAENKAKVLIGLSQTLEPACRLLSERSANENVKAALMKTSEGLQRKRWQNVNKFNKQQAFSENEEALALIEARMTGTSVIQSVLGYSEHPSQGGLHLIKVPGNLVEALSNMASSGCNLVMVISSRGILTGSVVLPCLTLAPDSMEGSFGELIDYSVTTESIAHQAEAVLNTLLEICSGKQTALEAFELGEYSIPHVGTTF